MSRDFGDKNANISDSGQTSPVDKLLDLGFLTFTRPHSEEHDPDSIENVPHSIFHQPAFEMPADRLIGVKKKRQPPMFWKAVGYALKKAFTASGDLSDDNRALFIGEPNQAGLQIGPSYPPEVTNYHLFTKADALQTMNRPVFTLRGDSYFEHLRSYLTYAGRATESDASIEAREALDMARLKKDEVFRWCCVQYAALPPTANQTSLIQYLDKNEDFLKAAKNVETAENTYAQLRKSTKSAEVLDRFTLADVRLEPRFQYNMPVIAIDQNWVQIRKDTGREGEDAIDQKLVYYRPWYNLSAFATTYADWFQLSAASSAPKRDDTYSIPLAGIWDKTWSALGHPELDDAAPSENLNAAQKDFVNSLTATLTFLYKPAIVDVHTGQWDVQGFRSDFPLQPDAPGDLREPICKTSKMILAWGMEIEIELPESSLSPPGIKNLTLSALDMPLKEVRGDGRRLAFQAGADGIPILVGTLADVI